MKSDHSDSTVDTRDKNGKDIETKDDLVKRISIKNKKFHKRNNISHSASSPKNIQ